MNTPTKLALYGLGLVVAFAGAVGVGRLAGPVDEPEAHRAAPEHTDASPDHTAAARPPGGLQVSDGGYRLVPHTAGLVPGVPTDFAFTILGPDGTPVTRFTPTHDKGLHLIVVRRDLSGFQHVHPTLASDGTWSIRLGVARAGQYRVFADFQPAGRDAPLTLGVDVPAAGTYLPTPLSTPTRTAEVDGYRVELAGELIPGTASRLTLSVKRDGVPVSDLQPYLGAYGHLVALRGGDLAYLHVHPDGSPGDGRTAAGPDITFHAEVPSAGTYRLYLDFQHNGTVRTAEFTAVAEAPRAAASPPGTPSTPGASPGTTTHVPGHGDPHGHG